ncbi:MAG: hypothetical protein P8X90_23755 [Desulfobacterales bacterium]|jgi:hypothetical protein
MEEELRFLSPGCSLEGLLEKNSKSGADHFYGGYTAKLEAVLSALLDDAPRTPSF